MIFKDILERLRRGKRCFDNVGSFRKMFLAMMLMFALIVYVGPWFLKWLSSHKGIQREPIQQCVNNHIESLSKELDEFDAHMMSRSSLDSGFLTFVGNGKIGLGLDFDSPMYILNHRVLTLQVPFYPIVFVSSDGYESSGASITSYLTGVVQKFDCIKKKGYAIDVKYQYYAHRTIPSILVQDIKIVNPLDEDIVLDLYQTGLTTWKGATRTMSRVSSNGGMEDVVIYKGDIVGEDGQQKFVVAIVQTAIPVTVQIKQKSSEQLHVVTSIQYAEFESHMNINAAKENLILLAQRDLERSLAVNSRKLREDHAKVWSQLWSSGLSISFSKAANALNGDKINATMYFVMSHTQSPLHEVDTSDRQRYDLTLWLNSPEHCYAGIRTIEASTLWSDLKSIESVAKVVSLWKLTLEKHGCHTLMRAGADGVVQAMILSFGAFKFSNHHIEFGMQPKSLHRDYLFRRIGYGNGTHLNVSVVVGENNKAGLYVALDRSDKNYYACDSGCLDPPVLLTQEKQSFPVKLTDPPTAILYITSDKQHLEELKHIIHFKEVVEAPAHEHHVIALHRHGHHFGGLPMMFWVSISFLVAIFHLFLFKLIYNEYCASQEKYRLRHSL